MGQAREQERIRPTVWLFALACLLGAGLSLYLIAGTSAPAAEEASEDERERADEGEGTDERGPRRGRRPLRDDDSSGRRRTFDPYHDQRIAAAETLEREADDPQLVAMQRSMRQSGEDAPHFRPTYRTGRLTRVSGDLPLSEGDSCELRVLPVRAYRFSCLVRVMCNGLVVYPDPDQNAGYVACSVNQGVPQQAADYGFTGADGDPMVNLDLHGGRVTVGDQGPYNFNLEMSLDPEGV